MAPRVVGGTPRIRLALCGYYGRGQVARPTRCTPEVTQRVADAIRGGNYANVAAQYAGIGESTYYEWLQRGREGESPFAEFAEAIKEAEAQAEVRNMALIQQAAQAGTWQASAWYLERRYPSRYGRRERLEHSGPEGGPITLRGIADMMGVGEGE